MISIYTYSNPLFFQVDHSYRLPSNIGTVRWNGLTKNFEVSSEKNNQWLPIDPNVEIKVSKEIEELIQYMKEKKKEEERLDALAAKYPAIKSTKDKLDLLVRLLDEDS